MHCALPHKLHKQIWDGQIVSYRVRPHLASNCAGQDPGVDGVGALGPHSAYGLVWPAMDCGSYFTCETSMVRSYVRSPSPTDKRNGTTICYPPAG